MAMGGAFTAVADDANCAYWNAAGAAQLSNFRNGETQIIITNRLIDQTRILNRDSKSGIKYYDNLNITSRINNDFGWSLAAKWDGGPQIQIIPSIAYKLPYFEDMSIGIGYSYYKKRETKVVVRFYGAYPYLSNYYSIAYSHGINLDYLWKLNPEFSFGAHLNDLYQLINYQEYYEYYSAVEDIQTSFVSRTQDFEKGLLTRTNMEIGIAWMPMNGVIVNANGYDLLNKTKEPSRFSAGFEYSWNQSKFGEEFDKTKYPKHSLRAGVYNLNSPFYGYGDKVGSIMLGYGYAISKFVELGCYSRLSSGKYDFNLGVAWKF